MSELLHSPFFGLMLTTAAYAAGVKIQKKTGLVICNGLVLAALMIIAVLLVFGIPYEAYNAGGSLVNLMLSPATVCFAVTIYRRLEILKKNLLPVLVGCVAGAAASVTSVWLLSRLFGLDRALMISLLPKSVTTPIATALSQSNGGIVAITAASVIFTGILGNLAAPLMVRLLRVKNPVEAGLGIGACSHAVGTAKAMELGATEGALSSVAIGLCGIVTTILALLFPLLP
jgi:predicted murein hydrolase (TIGR00659 family)